MFYPHDLELLQQVQQCYAALAAFRQQRLRNKRYTYGQQWSDTVEVDGHRMTEEQYIRQQGSVPLKNNLIRRLVRNVIGIYTSQSNQPLCIARDNDEAQLGRTMTTLLEYNADLNRLDSLYARSMEEFLISGVVVHRKWYGVRNGRSDCWTDFVPPSNFFIDTNMRDFRGWDCQIIGEYHQCSFDQLCAQFAQSAEDCQRLRGIYGDAPSRCQVIEAWRKEVRCFYLCHDPQSGTMFQVAPEDYGTAVEAANRRRARLHQPLIKAQWKTAETWRFYYLSPMGHVLKSGQTPYAHGSHPYVLKAYPLIDGEIHSFVADVIDQQRYTNRLITLYDWILRASAKGVLLVPEDCIPRGISPDDFAESWAKFNGVIVYRPSQQGAMPQQVSCNSTNIGITELLNLQLKFFEDISGVNSALQGKLSNSPMSAELFGQQTQNATTTLLDLLNAFSEFVRDAAYKDVRNIQQFYHTDTVRSIVGKGCGTQRLAKQIKDVDFDLSIKPSNSTPAARQASNAMLMEIWKSGQITLEQMLEAGDFPFKIIPR